MGLGEPRVMDSSPCQLEGLREQHEPMFCTGQERGMFEAKGWPLGLDYRKPRKKDG
jgi:hypothetical protein